MDGLISRHIDERQNVHAFEKQLRQNHAKEVAELHRDIAEYIKLGPTERPALREQFREASRNRGDHGKGRRRDDPERSM
jgi:hypothetical protein